MRASSAEAGAMDNLVISPPFRLRMQARNAYMARQWCTPPHRTPSVLILAQYPMACGEGSGFGHVNPPKKHKPQSEKRPPSKRKPSRRTFRATALKTGHFGDVALSVRNQPETHRALQANASRTQHQTSRTSRKAPARQTHNAIRPRPPESPERPVPLPRKPALQRGLDGARQVLEGLVRGDLRMLGLDGDGAAEQETRLRRLDHAQVVVAVARGDGLETAGM